MRPLLNQQLLKWSLATIMLLLGCNIINTESKEQLVQTLLYIDQIAKKREQIRAVLAESHKALLDTQIIGGFSDLRNDAQDILTDPLVPEAKKKSLRALGNSYTQIFAQYCRLLEIDSSWQQLEKLKNDSEEAKIDMEAISTQQEIVKQAITKAQGIETELQAPADFHLLFQKNLFQIRVLYQNMAYSPVQPGNYDFPADQFLISVLYKIAQKYSIEFDDDERDNPQLMVAKIITKQSKLKTILTNLSKDAVRRGPERLQLLRELVNTAKIQDLPPVNAEALPAILDTAPIANYVPEIASNPIAYKLFPFLFRNGQSEELEAGVENDVLNDIYLLTMSRLGFTERMWANVGNPVLFFQELNKKLGLPTKGFGLETLVALTDSQLDDRLDRLTNAQMVQRVLPDLNLSENWYPRAKAALGKVVDKTWQINLQNQSKQMVHLQVNFFPSIERQLRILGNSPQIVIKDEKTIRDILSTLE